MRPGRRSMLADLATGWRKKWVSWAREREQKDREEIWRRFNTEGRQIQGRDEACVRRVLGEY